MVVAAVAQVAKGGVGFVLSSDTWSVAAYRSSAATTNVAAIGQSTVFMFLCTNVEVYPQSRQFVTGVTSSLRKKDRDLAKILLEFRENFQKFQRQGKDLTQLLPWFDRIVG